MDGVARCRQPEGEPAGHTYLPTWTTWDQDRPRNKILGESAALTISLVLRPLGTPISENPNHGDEARGSYQLNDSVLHKSFKWAWFIQISKIKADYVPYTLVVIFSSSKTKIWNRWMPKVYCVYQKSYLSNYDRGHVRMISSGWRGDPKDLKYSSMTMTQASFLAQTPSASLYSVVPSESKLLLCQYLFFFRL